MSRPRIRYIKPEIWTSRDFNALTPIGRLTFMCLISNADDEGRLKTDPGHLARTYLPGCMPDEIAAQLELMEERGMAASYAVRKVDYIALLGWPKHQRFGHKQDSDLPAPPKFKRRAARKAHNGLQSDLFSSSGTRPNKRKSELESLRSAPESSGIFQSDLVRTSSSSPTSSPTTEREPMPDAGTALALVREPKGDVDAVFEAWKGRWHPTAKLTAERRTKIQARLRERWTVEDLILAVTDGAAADPWENRHVALNDDLAHLLRNSTTVEKFVGLARRTLATVPAPKPHRLDQWAADVMGGSRGKS